MTDKNLNQKLSNYIQSAPLQANISKQTYYNLKHLP